MIAVLSPAKQMLPAVRESLPVSQPVFLQQAGILQKELSRFSPWELEALLKINPELAMKAYTNYQNFSLENTGPPAILS
ncbi:MAG: peroxide stress protein YaaA, partial [Clostridiales bacterium]|nr:peroxide stress protein YaaA [Clostridiales bacterium]